MSPRLASPHDSAASPPAPTGKRPTTMPPTPESKAAAAASLLPVKPRLRGKLHRSAAFAAAAAGASMVASASRVSAQAGWACLIYT